MSHDAHKDLPGWRAGQILVDGCAECVFRADKRDLGIATLDSSRFAEAWARAHAWGTDVRAVVTGADVDHPVDLSPFSRAELPMLGVLWAVQVQLEQRGFPVGHCPDGHAAATALEQLRLARKALLIDGYLRGAYPSSSGGV